MKYKGIPFSVQVSKGATVKHTLSTILPLVAMGAILSACQTSAPPEEVAKQQDTIRSEIVLGRSSVIRATDSLAALQNASDAGIKPAFEVYTKSVADLESKAGGVGWVADMMQDQTDKYFVKWQNELKEVENSDVRNKGESRRAETLAAYQDVQAKIGTLRASFRPYMSNLKDCQKALSADLTPGGRSSVTPIFRQIPDQSKAVLRDADAVVAAIDKLNGR